MFSSKQILQQSGIRLRILRFVIHQKIAGRIRTQQTKSFVGQTVDIVCPDIIAVQNNRSCFFCSSILIVYRADLLIFHSCLYLGTDMPRYRQTAHKHGKTYDSNPNFTKQCSFHVTSSFSQFFPSIYINLTYI